MRWTGCVMMLVGVLLATEATAQDRSGDRGAAGRSTSARPGMPPLQTEPGDIWADVRSWDSARRPVAPAEQPRQPPRRRQRTAPAGQ